MTERLKVYLSGTIMAVVAVPKSADVPETSNASIGFEGLD